MEGLFRSTRLMGTCRPHTRSRTLGTISPGNSDRNQINAYKYYTITRQKHRIQIPTSTTLATTTGTLLPIIYNVFLGSLHARIHLHRRRNPPPPSLLP